MQFPISNIDLGTHDIMEIQTDIYCQIYIKENIKWVSLKV